MKRIGNLYEQMISDENIIKAINEVNRTHRWRKHHRPNRVVAWVESDIPARVIELREIIENGYVPSELSRKIIYDKVSEKEREICEPRLFPDQYIHHILVQVLQYPIMRKMDNWACGSIPKRGTHYGVSAIKKWMKNEKQTKYCAELDIKKFYQSIKPVVVVNALKRTIKDRRVIDLCERVLADGVPIGLYTSQWFANLILQELDVIIRANSTHYIRYMDNMTIFHSNKRKLYALVRIVKGWLAGVDLELKDTYQIFNVNDRLPQALGYKYGRGYTVPRKRNIFRMKRQLSRAYKRMKKYKRPATNQAYGLLSRIGQLKWCSNYKIRAKYVRKGLQKKLKDRVRSAFRKEMLSWAN